jgi:NAD(P)-dependent dehydrogenase (short-subunit alcohol dehydrogenase family)
MRGQNNMTWKTVCNQSQTCDEYPFAAMVAGKEIGTFLVDGHYYALEDVCPHAHALLSQGFVEGGTIVRPLHEALDAGQRASGNGKFVMLASGNALLGAPRLLAHVASKGTVLAVTRSMTRELGTDICTNAIAPSPTRCGATEYVPSDRHALRQNDRNLSRAQIPAGIDGTALSLLSDLFDFISGQTMPVNGGFVFN